MANTRPDVLLHEKMADDIVDYLNNKDPKELNEEILHSRADLDYKNMTYGNWISYLWNRNTIQPVKTEEILPSSLQLAANVFKEEDQVFSKYFLVEIIKKTKDAKTATSMKDDEIATLNKSVTDKIKLKIQEEQKLKLQQEEEKKAIVVMPEPEKKVQIIGIQPNQDVIRRENVDQQVARPRDIFPARKAINKNQTPAKHHDKFFKQPQHQYRKPDVRGRHEIKQPQQFKR